MDRERFEKQKDFILEADKEKTVLRQTHLTNHGRNEDGAEHAWHMALMTYLLSEYSDEKIDVARTMIMCLIHDIVEIDAGDTYAYDEEGKKTQDEREEKAADRIFALLPEDQAKDLREIFEEFQERKTPEARFARAMDNLQPLLLNDSNGGGDWREHGVSYSQVRGRQDGTKAASQDLYAITREILDKHLKSGDLKDDSREND